MQNLNIQWVSKQHLDGIVRIEQEVFEFPWTKADFNRVFRQRKIFGLVGIVGSKIVAFAVCESTGRTLDILNLGVAKDYQRKGIGRAMVDRVKTHLSSMSASRIALEIRETNLPAQVFFRKQGFSATNIAHNFYDDCPEDAYVFSYEHVVALRNLTNRMSTLQIVGR